ncbi:hypothetical protein [Rhizobium sp. 9140]|uniref:hypothetical protein n=1 Tax=Rhizobium sp. 9140 TaxID=1761900 RepID=UPI000799C3F9|nr:hypothetical protein [Rhizobium sp. 9140]CZT34607.1 hypothetical protein GA0004734_00016240 [Rhizobium sp. 9140]
MVYLKKRSHAKPQPKQIIGGEKRKFVISKIIDILDDFRLSRFENEGAIRAGVRSALCLAGNGWHPSDSEAAALLATAFTKMGAHRPSWLEGQKEYVLAQEECFQCGRDLDEESIARNDRFCSENCRTTARVYREGLERFNRHRVHARVGAINALSRAPERKCAQCSKGFFSAKADQIFCSHACYQINERNPLRHRQCAHCSTNFVCHQGGDREQRFCSSECFAAGREVRQVSCLVCETTFSAKSARAKFCGPKCTNIFHRRKRLEEAKLTASEFQTHSEAEPSVLISDASNILRHPALTIEAFDALFHPPRRPTLAETLAASFGGQRPFVSQGELVRDLRVRLIQEGLSWSEAQAEAEQTVDEAIQIAGLERPRSTIAGGYRLSQERKAVR